MFQALLLHNKNPNFNSIRTATILLCTWILCFGIQRGPSSSGSPLFYSVRNLSWENPAADGDASAGISAIQSLVLSRGIQIYRIFRREIKCHLWWRRGKNILSKSKWNGNYFCGHLWKIQFATACETLSRFASLINLPVF